MCIPLSRPWANNVHRKKYHNNTVLLFKGTSIPSLFRTVLLKGHLFLLCFFVRDNCLFSLFCNLDFVHRPLFFCHSLFFRRSLSFRRSLFLRLFTIFSVAHLFLLLTFQCMSCLLFLSILVNINNL